MILELIISFLSVNILLKFFTSLKYFKKKFFTFPNARSSHIKPTLTGGGFAFIIPSLVLSIVSLIKGDTFTLNFIVLLALPLSLIGLIDDINGVAPLTRFFIQTSTVFSLIIFAQIHGYGFNSFDYGISYLILIFMQVLFGIAAINFVNFMDGLDGLVISNFIVYFITLAIKIEPQLWPLIFALLAFLFWNWSPAKVFMGDVGSTFLGAVFVGILFLSSSFNQFISYTLVMTPLFADAFFCVIRRFLNNQNIFSAHKLHLYQRLNQIGWSHSKVTIIYLTATSILSAISIFKPSLLYYFAAIVLLIGFLLDNYVAVDFRKAITKL